MNINKANKKTSLNNPQYSKKNNKKIKSGSPSAQRRHSSSIINEYNMVNNLKIRRRTSQINNFYQNGLKRDLRTNNDIDKNENYPSSRKRLNIQSKDAKRSRIKKFSYVMIRDKKMLLIMAGFGVSIFFFLMIIVYSISSIFSNSVSLLTGENVDPYLQALYNEIEDTAINYKKIYGVDIDRHLLVATLTALKDHDELSNKTPAQSFLASFFSGEEGKQLKDYSVTFAGRDLSGKIRDLFTEGFAKSNTVYAGNFSDLVDKIIAMENDNDLNHHIILVIDKGMKIKEDDILKLMKKISPNHQIFINTMPGDASNLSIIRKVAFIYKNINIVDFAYYGRSDENLYKDRIITEDGEKKLFEVLKNSLIGETDKNGSTKVATLSNKKLKSYINLLAKYQIMTHTNCNKDSSNFRKIASNDDDGGINIFSSDEKKEKNYICNNSLSPRYEISIEQGFIDDDSSGSVYYWNLIDEKFISEEYYNEYFDTYANSEDIYKEKDKLVKYIYEYADVLRKTVPIPKGLKESAALTTGVAANGGNVSVNCPTINVVGYGNVKLEDYVAGVMSQELSPSYSRAVAGDVSLDEVKEGLKAFSMMIRTYGINRSNECNVPIRPTTEDQVYAPTSDHIIKDIVASTKGLVLTKDSKLFSTEYDSYYCEEDNCSGNMCSCEYTYLPSGKVHDVKIPLSFAKFAAGGHGRGASQIALLYLSSQGKKAEEIVPYFYQEDVKISKIGE